MRDNQIDGSPIDEQEWLKAASTNPAFNSLAEPNEDVYTLDDGRPFPHEVTEVNRSCCREQWIAGKKDDDRGAEG